MNKILTFGVYDYFHLGHLRLFKQCKECTKTDLNSDFHITGQLM